jgi:hypothetical protein
MQGRDDEIVDEVRRVRAEHAAARDYDLARIIADLREEEGASNATVVTLERKIPGKIAPLR